ncbi:hypothetical protein [Silicimonas sp. MF1-12-2]|uniref:hypothetical protein n=1 Tax=Silicimonas sp. MF1-12-2 TaxID=3384793 RepID=UPI0039B55D4A
MPKFAFIYRGGNRPEDGAAHMEKWRVWSTGLGDANIYPGMPFAGSVTVSAAGVIDGSGDVPMTGVTVIEADDLETAIEHAKACPHLELDGQIVVAQGVDMEM